jgi:hypothetical protein
MEQPITVSFRWSADDYIQSYRYYFRHICRPTIRIGLHFIFALMLLGGVLGCFKERGSSLVLPGAFVIVGVYWFVFRGYDLRWTLRRRYAKRPDKESQIEWQITPEKLSTRSRLGYAEFSWEALVKVVRTPSGIVLYPLDQLWYYLPRRGFTGDADFERAAALAKSKVQRFYHVA